MATQAIEQAPEAAAEAAPAAPAAPGKRNLIILAVAGLLAGSAAGLFAIGPILVKRKASHPAPKVEEKPATPITHEFQNIVLNPAGSGGTRFLMVSAAFELKDGGADQLMKDHEPEIRDRILALLGKKTIDELTDIGMRESIKKEVLESVAPILPKGAVLKVFFPQFVIQ